MKLDRFTLAYIECALWSSTEYGGETLDLNYGIEDLAPETLQQMVDDCADFRSLAGDKLCDLDDERAGRDFWLTRNRHGAGFFWDRGLGKLGDDLTKDARSYGSVDLYVADGKIYG